MKKKWFILAVIVLIVLFYKFHSIFIPTEVIGVHQNGHWVHIVVKNFPVTDKARIAWWKENEKKLKVKYNIPVVNSYDGSFDIAIWDFGDGYKKEEPKWDSIAPSRDTSYLICFDDMKTDVNCVEKEMLLSISHYRDPRHRGKMRTDFLIGNDTYRQDEYSEEIIKVDDDN